MALTNQIIYAPTVHQGGGRILLLPILDALKDDKHTLFILDERLQVTDFIDLYGQVIRVKPTLVSRLILEYRLWRLAEAQTDILCLGSLPPLLSSMGNIVVFVQNRYLLENISLRGFSIFVKVRIQVERWWLKARAHCVANFIVQSSQMKKLLQQKFWRNADVLPYAILVKAENNSSEKCYDYLYVASGEPHKNHQNLIKAWVIMAKKGQFPSLCLTLNAEKTPKLNAWIDRQCQQYDLKIKIVGEMPHHNIQQLYFDSKVLIYPSTAESLGLPLLEAAFQGLPIIASDLSFVHDVIKPTATFNPESPESISKAIMNADTSKPAEIVGKLSSVGSFLACAFPKLRVVSENTRC